MHKSRFSHIFLPYHKGPFTSPMSCITGLASSVKNYVKSYYPPQPFVYRGQFSAFRYVLHSRDQSREAVHHLQHMLYHDRQVESHLIQEFHLTDYTYIIEATIRYVFDENVLVSSHYVSRSYKLCTIKVKYHLLFLLSGLVSWLWASRRPHVHHIQPALANRALVRWRAYPSLCAIVGHGQVHKSHKVVPGRPGHVGGRRFRFQYPVSTVFSMYLFRCTSLSGPVGLMILRHPARSASMMR